VVLKIKNHNIMAKELRTEIQIKAIPDKIWAILTNFDNYPKWNPFIKSISGNVAVGNTIVARIEPPNGSGMTFKPKVLVFEKNKKFTWLGHFLFKGLFDGEHRFELIDNQNGTITFIQSEKFGGILVPLFSKMIDVNTKAGFQLMNEKLKELAEKY
jgi:hypothetical protein